MEAFGEARGVTCWHYLHTKTVDFLGPTLWKTALVCPPGLPEGPYCRLCLLLGAGKDLGWGSCESCPVHLVTSSCRLAGRGPDVVCDQLSLSPLGNPCAALHGALKMSRLQGAVAFGAWSRWGRELVMPVSLAP